MKTHMFKIMPTSTIRPKDSVLSSQIKFYQNLTTHLHLHTAYFSLKYEKYYDPKSLKHLTVSLEAKFTDPGSKRRN